MLQCNRKLVKILITLMVVAWVASFCERKLTYATNKSETENSSRVVNEFEKKQNLLNELFEYN